MGAISQRSGPARREEVEVPSLGTLEPAAPSPAPLPQDPVQVREALGRAVSTARTLEEGQAREEAAAALNVHFTALESLEPADAAGILRDLLDSRVLENLQGPDGWTARAHATALLISLPWPHALEVIPEDLLHLREVQRSARTTRRSHRPLRRSVLLPLGIVGIGVLLDAVVGTSPGLILGLASMGAALLAGGLLPLRWLARTSICLLLAGGLAGAALPVLSGNVDGFFMGVGAFFAGLVTWLMPEVPPRRVM